MVTPAIFIALIGTLQAKGAISAAISYEPIQITVNENFNAEPGEVPTEFKSNLEPGVVHQGANFYFKPRFNLPSSSISHHIESLISLIQQHHSCAKDATKVVFEKDKLMEILMPFLKPKEALSDSLMEEENNSEIVETVPILITEEPAISELEVIPEAPVLSPLSFNGIPYIVEEEVKKDESVILEESTGVFNEVEPKPDNLELVIIPEVRVLPPLAANDIHIVEEVTVEDPITLTIPQPIVVDVDPKPATPNILVIPEAPVLPPLSFNGMPLIVEEEVKKEESAILEESTDIFSSKPTITVGPITEPITTNVEPKPTTLGVLVIPEPPVLPSLSFNVKPSFVEKEVKNEKFIILEESTGLSQEPTIIEIDPIVATPELDIIPEAPILPALSGNDIRIVEEEKIEEPISLPMPEPIFESKPKISELVVIPEAPVIPPLPANNIHTVEEVTVEDPIILTKPEPVVVDVEPKPATPNLLVIPQAPVLPPLSFNGMPAIVEEEVKKEKSVILEESTDIFYSKPTITVGPITEPIITYVEPKPTTTGLLVIPEAPVLPSLSFNDIPYFVGKEVKKEESIILEESTDLSQEPTIIEIEPKAATTELEIIPEAPILPALSENDIHIVEEEKIEEPLSLPMPEPIFESKSKISEFVIIPEAAVIPPLPANNIHTVEEVTVEDPIILTKPEPIVVDVEPKPATHNFLVIPQAPVLPPLSFNGMPSIVEEQVKKEKSAILEESTDIFYSKPTITVGPITEPIITYVEPKPTTTGLLVIPEAPVLPSLSFNYIPSFVGKEMKKEKSIILEESTDLSQEPTIIEIEPKVATTELEIIPEAPILPALPENDIRIVKEKKIEEPISLPMPEPIFAPNPKISELVVIPEAPVLPSRPANDIHIVEEVTVEDPITFTKPEPIVVDVPEAPVLSPLYFNDISTFVEKEMEKKESIILEGSTGESHIIEIEPKPATPEFIIMPEAPVLPPLSPNDIRIVEEMNIKEPTILPIPESINDDIEPKPATLELFVVPEAPMLPPLSFNGFPSVVEEELKKEESVMLEESTSVLQEPTIIDVEPKPANSELVVIPEAPLPPLPPMPEIPVIEEVKSDESVLLEETGSFAEISAPTLESFVENETAESFALENNKFPVATEEIKIEIPILLEESIEIQDQLFRNPK